MNTTRTKNLLVFAHVPKSAGTYVNNYLVTNVLKDYKIINFLGHISYHPKIYLSTHFFTPPTTAIDKLNEQEIEKKFRTMQKDWFFFAFVRDPREAICSLYAQLQDMLCNELVHHPLSYKGQPIDDFIEKVNYQSCLLPPYWREFDFIAEFNDANFAYFLKKYFNHPYQPQKTMNKSSNQGYTYHCKQGAISAANQKKIQESKQFHIYQDIIHTPLT